MTVIDKINNLLENVKEQKAKSLGLTHVSFNNYIDKNQIHYNWDGNNFVISKDKKLEDYMEIQKYYLKKYNDADDVLQKIIKGNTGEMGLVNKETAQRQDYKDAVINYNKSHKEFGNYQKSIPKKIMKQIDDIKRKDRQSKWLINN